MISIYSPITILLLWGLLFGACVEAQEPSPAVFEEALARLDERIGVLKNQFPSLPLATILAGSSKQAIVNLNAADPRKALEMIQHTHKKLDKAVFSGLKRLIYATGAAIEQNPTTRSNAARRREALLEFAEIVKRQGLVMTSYYPGGVAKFGMITSDTEDGFKAIDERYKVLADRLKREVEQAQASGGGGSGGGGGGDWSAGGEEDPAAATGERPGRDTEATGSDVPRAMRGRSSDWQAVLMTGVAIIAVGSALVLLLPRFVAYSRSFLKLGLSRRMPVVAEDPFKLGLAQFQKNRFDKALDFFQRVALEPGERAVQGAYYLALTLVKLERKGKALQQIGALPLVQLSTEEVYRLARACEESTYNETSAMLFRHVYQRDPSYKDVRQRIAKDGALPPEQPS